MRAADPKYSMRNFASKLGLSIAGLSLVLSRKRDLGVERAAEVLGLLNLNLDEENRLLALMKLPVKRVMTAVSDANHFILTDWIYFAVLHFFELEVEKKDATEIAKRFALDSEKVEQAIDKLIEGGFLVRSEWGEIKKVQANWSTGDGPPSHIVRSYHLENLKVAQRALDFVEAPHRDFSAVTFCGGSKEMEAIRNEIREFHHRISAIMAGSKVRDEVYRLSVSLFPMNFQGPPL